MVIIYPNFKEKKDYLIFFSSNFKDTESWDSLSSSKNNQRALFCKQKIDFMTKIQSDNMSKQM